MCELTLELKLFVKDEIRGCMVVQWLPLLPHSRKVLVQIPIPVCLEFACAPHACFLQIPAQPKNMLPGLNDGSEYWQSLSVSECVCSLVMTAELQPGIGSSVPATLNALLGFRRWLDGEQHLTSLLLSSVEKCFQKLHWIHQKDLQINPHSDACDLYFIVYHNAFEHVCCDTPLCCEGWPGVREIFIFL